MQQEELELQFILHSNAIYLALQINLHVVHHLPPKVWEHEPVTTLSCIGRANEWGVRREWGRDQRRRREQRSQIDDPIFVSPSYFLRWPHHHVTVLIWEKRNRPGQRTQVSPLHCSVRARNMINKVDFKKQTSTTFGNFLQHMATVGSL